MPDTECRHKEARQFDGVRGRWVARLWGFGGDWSRGIAGPAGTPMRERSQAAVGEPQPGFMFVVSGWAALQA
jgi:hypothetical protein